jgi:hypothetical protein
VQKALFSLRKKPVPTGSFRAKNPLFITCCSVCEMGTGTIGLSKIIRNTERFCVDVVLPAALSYNLLKLL